MGTPPTVWACYARTLPTPVAADCHAYGEGPTGAERHTRETGHPTTEGTPGGVVWAVAP